MKNITELFFLFSFILLTGCVTQRPQTLVMTDYIPSNQVAIPNFSALQQAASTGDAIAQYELGKLYAEGLGVPKSHRKAMELWNKSAVQGYAPAQYSLGWMYFYGSGVVTNYQEGCRWMHAAGEQGLQGAIIHYNKYCVTGS